MAPYLLILACIATYAGAAEDLVQAPVYTSGDNGYDTYRIPAVVVTLEGTVLAFCEGRKSGSGDSGNIDIVLRRSRDNGDTWSDMEVIVDDGAHTCGNPAPVVDQNTGSVLLLITKNRGSDTEGEILRGQGAPRTVWISRSADDGLSWSAPEEITASVRRDGWRWYATGPGHGIQLRDGRLMIPCNHAYTDDTATWRSHVIVSDDHGATWAVGGVHEGHTNESTVTELANGTLYQNMRNYRKSHRRACAYSMDRGDTWSPVQEDPALLEPVCQASTLRVDRARSIVLFSNPADTKRMNMTIKASYDGCQTWPDSLTLHEGPSAYSDLAELRDGRIGCLYERGEEDLYETITFARFPLGTVTGRSDDDKEAPIVFENY